MHFTIFYAWQSDRPEKVNKYFIRDAAESAIKAIRADAALDLAPSLDHDTKGVPGIPDIPSTICEKIDNCGIFLADMTFSGLSSPENGGKKPKHLPNPNVLIELGYALASVGPRRIIYVMNTAFGPPDELPFDIRVRRHPISYELADRKSPRREEIQKDLASKLKEAIQTIIGSGALGEPSESPSKNVRATVLDWRKKSVEQLWTAVRALREATPAVLFQLDFATEDEYPSLIKSDRIRVGIQELTNELVAREILSRDGVRNVEDIRPVIGEPLWQSFSSYQNFLARACLVTGGKLGKGTPWYRDEATLHLLSNALTPKHVTEISKLTIGKLASARQCFESRILERIRSMLPPGTVIE